MKYRKLRIAWSAAWGIVALLLVGWWVRSYSWWDVVTVGTNHSLATMKGSFLWDTPLVAVPRPGATPPASQTMFPTQSMRLNEVIVMPFDKRVAVYDGRAMTVPIWWAVVGAAGIAALGWWRLRYSLRTMLVATTLVAIGLVVGIRWFRG